jgi:hypothetical protein
VTRLGEFSPIRWLFTLGSFLLNYRSTPHIWAAFSRSSLCINFNKKWFGLHFGWFFTASCGHPGWLQRFSAHLRSTRIFLSRVTRLGKFLPRGQILNLRRFSKTLHK